MGVRVWRPNRWLRSQRQNGEPPSLLHELASVGALGTKHSEGHYS